MRTVLSGYQGRYGALKDAVTETVPEFADDVLATFDVVDLLTEPVYVMAGPVAAGVSAGRIVGLGTDLVEVDRFRLALAAAGDAPEPPVQRRRAASTRHVSAILLRAWRCASRRRKR